MKVKKLTESAILPTYGSEGAAAADLYADTETEIVIRPHETILIGTGLAINVPQHFFGAIFARSGIATKQGLRPANCVGVVDSDYRGEVKVALHNDSEEPQKVAPHSRIAQFAIIKCYQVPFDVVDELDETERGEGGFGSTGQ